VLGHGRPLYGAGIAPWGLPLFSGRCTVDCSAGWYKRLCLLNIADLGAADHSESAANLLIPLGLNSALFSECALISLKVLADFDSTMRRFECSPATGDFALSKLRKARQWRVFANRLLVSGLRNRPLWERNR
jgi:hypothetical protein